jgi:hypothetical protein
MILPLGLLCLSSAILACAQSNQQLSINSVVSFTSSSVPNPPVFTLPASDALAISVAICSGTSLSPYPRFFLTNSSAVPTPGSSSLGMADVFEIVANNGLGIWEGSFSAGGILTVEGLDQMSFELGVSDGGGYIVTFASHFLLNQRLWGLSSSHPRYSAKHTFARRYYIKPSSRFLGTLQLLTFHTILLSSVHLPKLYPTGRQPLFPELAFLFPQFYINFVPDVFNFSFNSASPDRLPAQRHKIRGNGTE